MKKLSYTHAQNIPYNPHEIFFKQKNELGQFISSQTQHNKFANAVNPFPLYVSTQTVQHIKSIHDVLIKAIYALVNNYLTDDDIAKNMPLTANILKILSLYKQKEYKIGVLRPDYLFDANGRIKICEINARFTTNGILITDILKRFHTNNEFHIDNAISHYLQYFDNTQKIFIVKDREPGLDIHLLNEYLNKNNINSTFIAPDELHIQDNKLYAKNELCAQLVLELHQDELLAIPFNILEKIITETRYINDLRTVFIVHDKRFLTLLGNKKLMLKYLNADEFTILDEAIIPTVLLQTMINKLENKDLWVLKKCLSGKGEGMYLGKNISNEEFDNVVNNLSDLYIAQKFISQQSQRHVISTNEQKIKNIEQLLVGTFISFNGNYLGLGIARGSTKEIINVATGGTIFAVLEYRSNKTFKITHYLVEDICILTIEGKLNHQSYNDFDNYVSKLSNYSRFVIDCRDLSYLSSIGLQSLIILAQQLHDSNGHLILCEVDIWVKDILDVSGIHNLIPRCDNLQQALRYLWRNMPAEAKLLEL